MILYPAIELHNGQCVSLYRGRIEEPEIWHVKPIDMARSFSEAGAEWIHITDFDAILGKHTNDALVQDLIDHSGASIQLGGGFRSVHRIAEWIDRGAARIVVGTLAVFQPDLVKKAAKLYPDQIVIAVDVFQGSVMSDGWRKPSAIDPEAFIRTFEKDPLAGFIVTDIDANLGDTDDSLSLVTRLAGIAKAPVIARGLSRSLDDLSRLKYVPHIAGAIVGRAFFDRSIDPTEALALAQQPLEETASFA